MSQASRVAALLVLAACGHSEPFTTADQRNDGPFASTVPLRLTHADGADMHPAWSEDGSAIVYSYRRGTADGDRCLGVLPVGGGTRLAEICALPLEGEGLLDAYTHGAMDADGRLILNRHANLPTVPSPGEGEFLLTRADSVGGRTRVVPLLQTPPGSPAPWTYLLTPAWAGPGRVVALAAEQTVGSWNPYISTPPRPFDTTARASLIVEVLVDQRPVRWNTLAQTDWVTMLAVDRAAGLLYFVRSTPRNASEVLDAARLADTVYRMPIDGGAPTPVYGAPRAPTELVGGVVGLAAGGGRLFIAELRGDDPPSLRPAGDTARLREILPDGTLRTIDARPIATAGHWGRIAVSPDGRQLVAELHTGTGQADLYLMPTGP
jgi:hypothetical protein